jgi:hypothetical protein
MSLGFVSVMVCWLPEAKTNASLNLSLFLSLSLSLSQAVLEE